MQISPRKNSGPHRRQAENGQTKAASGRANQQIRDGDESAESESSHYSDALESLSEEPRIIAAPPIVFEPNERNAPQNKRLPRLGQREPTAEQRLDHENSVEDQRPSDSLTRKIRQALTSKASTFGRMRADPAIHTAKVTADTDAVIKKAQTAITVRGVGLTKVQVSGTLVLDSEDSKHLARLVGTGPIPVTAITPTVLRQLNNDGHLRITMAAFLDPTAVAMHLENDQGVKTHLSSSSSSRQPIRLRQFSRLASIYETQKIRRVHETALTSIACSLACSCLRHHEYHLFAEIIAVAPKRLMQQMTNFPFEGNLFSSEAILAVLRRLSPASSRDIVQLESGQIASEAIFLALKHYLTFSPVLGLQRRLPKALSLQRKGSKNRDLLIQNSLKFVAEVAFLGERCMQAPDLSKPATYDQAKQVAAQVALLVGNSFQYAIEFCEGLQKDQQALLSKLGTGVEIVKVAIGAVGTATAMPGGLAEGTALGATKIGDMIAKWATQPDQQMNIPKIAAQLARLSDAYKDRSRDGLLVPGDIEMTPAEMQERESDNSPEEREKREIRKRVATIFRENYSAHLANFKKRYLESSLAAVAP